MNNCTRHAKYVLYYYRKIADCVCIEGQGPGGSEPSILIAPQTSGFVLLSGDEYVLPVVKEARD